MKTFPTIDAARQARSENPAAVCVLEIDHATAGRCFCLAKCPMEIVRRNLRALPEIKRLVAEFPLDTPEEDAAKQAALEAKIRANACCERCGVHVDMDTCFRQQEWARFGSKKVRCVAYYCRTCENLLNAIGAGEYTAMQERAGEVPSYEPATKSDDYPS